jgi:hypothetical protein
MNKLLNFICLLNIQFFISQHLIGQSKIDTSYFVVSSDTLVDTEAPKSLAYLRSFCVYREYFDANSFMEKNLFGNNFFLIKNKMWYIKKEGKWKLFFLEKEFKKRVLYFENYNFMLIPWETFTENGRKLYKYYMSVKNDYSDKNPNEYVVFSPIKGIVKIINNSVMLVRVDKRPRVFFQCK